jgi:hypothetical protein
MLGLCAPGTARAQPALPGFAELEAAGATIGEIRVLNENIFDTDDPEENKRLYRWANRLHVRTQEGVIRRALLFRSGERVSVSLIEETERVLRSTRYLYDVRLRPLAYHDGVVDIEVATRDTWTLNPGLSFGRSGGANSGGINLSEYNLLGTGIAVGYGHSNNVDRSGDEFRIADDHVFGDWTSASYSRSRNSDGKQESGAVVRPFYALDTRWMMGAKASRDDRIESIYNAGNIASQYRHRQNLTEVIAGWSTGRVQGWVTRYSVGMIAEEDRYALEPGLVAPAALRADQKRVGPFFRFEVIEDRFEKLENRNLIGRPEFFALGLVSAIQLGRASVGLGSSRDAWLYSASVSRGFVPGPGQTLIASAAINGQSVGGQVAGQRLGAAAQYYLPQASRWVFYAAVAADCLQNPDVNDALLLGGDNGLRGYPLRYQSGLRRALFTIEERVYSDLYLWRLIRVGAAAFFDLGHAWGGTLVNNENPGRLRDAGVGLRILSDRAALSNVLHLDLAFPLDTVPGMKRVQFQVKLKASF